MVTLKIEFVLKESKTHRDYTVHWLFPKEHGNKYSEKNITHSLFPTAELPNRPYKKLPMNNTTLKLLRKTLLSVSDNCVINLPKVIIFVWKYVWIADGEGMGMRIGDILKVKAHNYRHYSEHSLIVKWRLRPVCVLFWRRRMWNKWRETIHCGILPFRFHPEEWCREISVFAWIS